MWWILNKGTDSREQSPWEAESLSQSGNSLPFKVKVKLSLCVFFLTEHHVMKVYWGVEA